MTKVEGTNRIGFDTSQLGPVTLRGVDPTTQEPLDPPFAEATPDEIDAAMRSAARAFASYRKEPGARRAAFLEAIAERIDALGPILVDRAVSETGLPQGRIEGERARTTSQLRMFADLVREGSWVDARIERGNPDRTPLPKPDVRRMEVALGPVVVFGASNFPLAFSVAGGDTASALAAGCPVVVKAHPAHPGTSDLVGQAILQAAEATGMPDGVFSLLHGAGHEVGIGLVKHPSTRAVGFTGSHRAGRALFDAAARRDDPIPVYAEMGSVNPVFVLPGAAAERGDRIANDLVASVTLGGGQFCTKPGLVFAVDDPATERLFERIGAVMREAKPSSMLYGGICDAFAAGVRRVAGTPGVTVVGASDAEADVSRTQARPTSFRTDAASLRAHPALADELFGPATLLVAASTREELLASAHGLAGHLTATVHATEGELDGFRELIEVLEQKVGRLIFNGYPTGVDVSSAMQHGGPYPATTDVRTTSVGTAAIHRFARPIAFQDAPQATLPPELRDGNPLGIRRSIDGGPESA